MEGDALSVVSGRSREITHKWGLPVPENPRKRAIFFNRSLNVDKIRRLEDAAACAATWKQAAERAGMYPEELGYMMKLGRSGHPTYGRLVERLLTARAGAVARIQERMYEHADSAAGIKDGTAEKFLKMDEKDSWLDESRHSDIAVTANIGKVVINTNFDDDLVIVDGKIVEDDVVDAEVVGGDG